MGKKKEPLADVVPEALDVRGAAPVVGTTEKALRQRVARGTIPFRRWGGRIVFLRSDLLAFLARLDGVSVEQAMAQSERGQRRSGGGGRT